MGSFCSKKIEVRFAYCIHGEKIVKRSKWEVFDYKSRCNNRPIQDLFENQPFLHIFSLKRDLKTF